jgi:GntR family transcriptional regulator of gluconate operon
MKLLNNIPAINKNTYATEIVTILRKEIISGRIAPGERLMEAELAETLNISRVPIREGIRTLVAEGLLYTEPHHGTFVVELTPKDIEEIYEVRLALECQAAVRLCRTMTEEDKIQLDQYIEAFRNESKEHDDVALYDLDMRFHETLCRLSGNQRLEKAWSQLGSQLRMCFAVFVQKYRFEDFPQRHQAIVDALKTRKPEIVTKVLKEHIDSSITRTLKDYKLPEIQP